MKQKQFLSLIFILFLNINTGATMMVKCSLIDFTYGSNEKIKTCLISLDFTNGNESVDEKSDYRDIKAIKISDTNSTHLPNHFNNSFPALERFLFENSELIEINKESLINQKKLVEISFHGNSIKTIESGTFTQHKNLTKIDLSSNEISMIDSETFDGLTELVELYLNDNNIESFNHMIFQSNKILQVIRLDNNYLESLPNTIFNDLTELKELRLDLNYIKFLQGRLFIDNSKLEILTVSENRIEAIGKENFEIFKKLKEHNFCSNTCLRKLETGYDIEELINLAKISCSVDSKEEIKWLKEELAESNRIRRALKCNDRTESLYFDLIEKLKSENIFVLQSEFVNKQTKIADMIENIETLKVKVNSLQDFKLNDQKIEVIQKNFTNLNNSISTEITKIQKDVQKLSENFKNEIHSIQNNLDNITENINTKIIDIIKNIYQNLTSEIHTKIENLNADDKMQNNIQSMKEIIETKFEELKIDERIKNILKKNVNEIATNFLDESQTETSDNETTTSTNNYSNEEVSGDTSTTD